MQLLNSLKSLCDVQESEPIILFTAVVSANYLSYENNNKKNQALN